MLGLGAGWLRRQPHLSPRLLEPTAVIRRPDEPVTTQDIMGLLRDHYEGTAFDLSKGLGAGEITFAHCLASKTECSQNCTALPVDGGIG